MLKVPSILPNCAVPVADDLNVILRLPKSTTPSAPISIDLPALIVKVPVPFTVKLPFTVKSTSSCGVPDDMVNKSLDTGVPAGFQLPAVDHKLSPPVPVHTLVVPPLFNVTVAVPLKLVTPQPFAPVTDTNV